jgi:hypothetical protein
MDGFVDVMLVSEVHYEEFVREIYGLRPASRMAILKFVTAKACALSMKVIYCMFLLMHTTRIFLF